MGKAITPAQSRLLPATLDLQHLMLVVISRKLHHGFPLVISTW